MGTAAAMRGILFSAPGETSSVLVFPRVERNQSSASLAGRLELLQLGLELPYAFTKALLGRGGLVPAEPVCAPGAGVPPAPCLGLRKRSEARRQLGAVIVAADLRHGPLPVEGYPRSTMRQGGDQLAGKVEVAALHRFSDPLREVFQGGRRDARVLDPAPHRRPISRAAACAECARRVWQWIWRRWNLRRLSLDARGLTRCGAGKHLWGASGCCFNSIARRPFHATIASTAAVSSGRTTGTVEPGCGICRAVSTR